MNKIILSLYHLLQILVLKFFRTNSFGKRVLKDFPLYISIFKIQHKNGYPYPLSGIMICKNLYLLYLKML